MNSVPRVPPYLLWLNKSVFMFAPVILCAACDRPAATTTTTSAAISQPQPQSERVFSLEEAKTLLSAAPSWPDAKPYTEESERLIDVANKLSKLGTSDLRKVVEAHVNGIKDTRTEVDEWSKIYILNRVAFEVPIKYSKKARGNHGIFFGGWGGVPTSRDFANIRWPIDYRPDGKAEIVGSFGGYMGDSYLAVAEFDFFAEQFPRRK